MDELSRVETPDRRRHWLAAVTAVGRDGSPNRPRWPRRGDPADGFRALCAFTLIELLTVISIIAILAALLAPTLHHFAKGDRTLSATQQMLGDVARARQLAIANRTTVYMVFVPSTFWSTWGGSSSLHYSTPAWNRLAGPPDLRQTPGMTNLYGDQLTGYNFVSLHSLGDQPGQWHPRYLSSWKTLPRDSFIAQIKFTAPQYGSGLNPFVIETNPPAAQGFPIYGFMATNNIPFPTADVATNAAYGPPYVWLPFIAFNYLGQLVDYDGSVLNHDEYIPLAQGSVITADPATKLSRQSAPDVMESPPGNSTNTYNIIHIDALTGHARLEHQEVQ